MVPGDGGAALLRQNGRGNFLHPLRIHVSNHRQNHVPRGVECFVAVIQRLRRNLADALHAARDVGLCGVFVIQRPHHSGIDLPVRVVLNHPDFLRDNALLLFNALVRKIGDRDKGQQNFQVFLKLLRGVEIIPRHGVGGKRVGLRPVFRQILKRVAFLGVKHLVLQIMGDTGRSVHPCAVQLKAGVHPAVPRGKKGIASGKVRLVNHVDRQAVGQNFPANGFTDALIKLFFHAPASSPLRKYTVSSDTDPMASRMRSGVTARTPAASSSGVSSRPEAIRPSQKFSSLP
ncbi:hypothetical protein SDC9_125081 [bioreactor metagenome]|uniref:Uncharacterized protein n=1 Tax=bioreactor metagenome TaxID=1076179 RepID=A0A645CM94_9ZZZZ